MLGITFIRSNIRDRGTAIVRVEGDVVDKDYLVLVQEDVMEVLPLAGDAEQPIGEFLGKL